MSKQRGESWNRILQGSLYFKRLATALRARVDFIPACFAAMAQSEMAPSFRLVAAIHEPMRKLSIDAQTPAYGKCGKTEQSSNPGTDNRLTDNRVRHDKDGLISASGLAGTMILGSCNGWAQVSSSNVGERQGHDEGRGKMDSYSETDSAESASTLTQSR
jgi:hypothetical protein